MRFRSFDTLRLLDVVASSLSFTEAAEKLNLTKGAVSYQIKRLEEELGFQVFTREHRGIKLTEKGQLLWHASHTAFQDLERTIANLRQVDSRRITIATPTYFASRWLSPRLMNFIVSHPEIGLRVQPVVDAVGIRDNTIDMLIRWGTGDWGDLETELLLPLPAFATAGSSIAKRIQVEGLEQVLPELTLLHDREGSEAWADWHRAAGIAYRPARNSLVIPDPNVRVQAVIDGQGLALNDALVVNELDAGLLTKVSGVELDNYGFHLAYRKGALANPALRDLRNWILDEARCLVPQLFSA